VSVRRNHIDLIHCGYRPVAGRVAVGRFSVLPQRFRRCRRSGSDGCVARTGTPSAGSRLHVRSRFHGIRTGRSDAERPHIGSADWRLLLETLGPFHLPSAFDDRLDAIRSLVVDTSAAHGFREILQHGPRCTRQIAQVAVLPLGHHRHVAELGAAVGRRAATKIHFSPCWVTDNRTKMPHNNSVSADLFCSSIGRSNRQTSANWFKIHCEYSTPLEQQTKEVSTRKNQTRFLAKMTTSIVESTPDTHKL